MLGLRQNASKHFEIIEKRMKILFSFFLFFFLPYCILDAFKIKNYTNILIRFPLFYTMSQCQKYFAT